MHSLINKSTTIVIKIGSSLIARKALGDNNRYTIARDWLRSIAMDILALQKAGKRVVLVTSGAIACARIRLSGTKYDINHTDKVSITTIEKQALASIGQIDLMSVYRDIFHEQGLHVGQILLDKHDGEVPERLTNIRETMYHLWEMNAIPIVNENDSVTSDEIRIGDNDTLGAITYNIARADCLVILSDVDGLYDRNPAHHANATFVEHVTEFKDTIYEYVTHESGSGIGVGGMLTKLRAAEIIMTRYKTGYGMMIANGIKMHPISQMKRASIFSLGQTD